MTKLFTKSSTDYTRRRFLQTLVGGSMSGALGSIGQLTLMQQASAAAPTFSDYKALVCILLNGGNDSFNMLVPFGDQTDTGYSDYADIRGDLTINNNDLGLDNISTALHQGNLPTGSGNPYFDSNNIVAAYRKGLYPLTNKSIPLAVNGLMPELAQLIMDNKVSIVANMGNLVEPTYRSDILAERARLPLFLFAHNHQKRALQTGQADNLTDIGWAGRIADNWAGINSDHPLGLNISYAGNTPMMLGQATTPLVMNPGIPPEFTGMQANHSAEHFDRRALFKALAGQQNTSVTNEVSFGTGRTASTSNPFRQFYNRTLLKSLQVFDELAATWPDRGTRYVSKNAYGNDLFSIPSADTLGMGRGIVGGFMQSMRDVATLIDLGAKNAFNTGNYNRQLFMVTLNGFDTHGDQASRHAPLLRELSMGLWSFQKALEELGHANKVMTYTMSDFGRTMSRNASGTDHGWGAHQLVMGGDGSGLAGTHRGGQMLGELPDITLGGADDHRDKGRIIPKIAQDQLNATLCSWFGVDDALMASVFPNLQNFKTSGSLRSAYLNQLFAT